MPHVANGQYRLWHYLCRYSKQGYSLLFLSFFLSLPPSFFIFFFVPPFFSSCSSFVSFRFVSFLLRIVIPISVSNFVALTACDHVSDLHNMGKSKCDEKNRKDPRWKGSKLITPRYVYSFCKYLCSTGTVTEHIAYTCKYFP